MVVSRLQQRWRHVLRDFAGTLFLDDLESLVPLSNEERTLIDKVAAAAHLKSLAGRIGAAHPTILWQHT